MKRATGSKALPRRSTPRDQIELGYSERAHRYARAVVSGRVLACELIRLACRRHLDDLKASRRKEYRWKFDPVLADRFCTFFEGLPHVKDDFHGNASRGQLFVLGDWQLFIFCSIFGWVDKKTRNRRFSEAYVSIARKNGKTPMAAGVGLFMLAADGEYGAEVYTGASSKSQALEGLFDAALKMAKATPELLEAFGIFCNTASLVIAEKNSVFRPLIAAPKDGPAPHCVIADEYHEYNSDRLIAWARNGMVSRRQPLLFEITTAGSDLGSPCHMKHLEVIEVLRGLRVNDRLFGAIFTPDQGVDWKSETAMLMANPNYGVSVNPETLQHEIQQAAQSARLQNETKTKNLNIWVNADVAWMNLEKWNACADPEMREEDFRGEDCFEGVDLASRTDTVTKGKLFVRRLDDGLDHYYWFPKIYLNAEAVQDKKNTHFQEWKAKGFLIETPGNVTDYLQVIDDLIGDSMEFNLRELVFDPFHSAGLIQFLQAGEGWNQSVECVDIKQSVENMSPPMKDLEALVLTRQFHHDGNPVMTWMISNTVCHRDRKENIYPVRNSVANKIDGTIAVILALKRALAQTQQYTDTEVLVA